MNLRRTPFTGRCKTRRGFTLIEAALVTSIISFGILAMLELLATGTSANVDGAELTTAVNLARNVREMALGLSFTDPQTPTHWGIETGETLSTFDDLDDLSGLAFSPPIDGRRQTLTGFAGWQQRITVQTVDPDLLSAGVPNGSTPANRVTVQIVHNGRTITQLSWVVLDASL